MGLKGVCDTFAPSQPPPLRGRGTPSIFLQTDSPANHNHGSAAHLSANHSPAPQPPRPSPSASPNIPRVPDCRPALARPSEPLSRHRERGWGERADTPVATLGAILCAVRIDFRLPPQINPYPAQPATGVLGQSPKRVLVPFTRVKGTPRRRAVQTKLPKILSPPSGARKLFHPTQKQLTTLPLHQGLNGKQNCFT